MDVMLFGGGYLLVNQLLVLIVCGFSIYYFIALIIQFYLLLPILQKYKDIMMPISMIITIIAISLITYLIQTPGMQLPLIVYAGPFTTWFVFFMCGVYYSSSKINYSLVGAITVVIIGFILECIETYWINTKYGGGYGIKPSAFIYSFGVMMLVLSPTVKSAYKSNQFTAIIACIGKVSFGIYLIHCLVIKGLGSMLHVFGWGFSWIVVVIISSVLVMVARRMLPYKLNRYLGFS